MYGDLDLDATIGSRVGVPIALGLQFSFVDLAATYMPLLPQGTEQPWLVQVFLGARFLYFEQRLTIGSLPSVNKSESYVEPLIGAYFGYELSERWVLLLRLDASGFVSSDFTYNVQFGATWLFGSRRQWALSVGWRLMELDFSAGSGSQEHSVDVTLHGPYLALTWRF